MLTLTNCIPARPLITADTFLGRAGSLIGTNFSCLLVDETSQATFSDAGSFAGLAGVGLRSTAAALVTSLRPLISQLLRKSLHLLWKNF